MAYMDCCDWAKCTLCGECLMKCPVMGMDEAEAKKEFGLLLKGEAALRVFGECTLCFRCNTYCPEGLRPYELILQRISESQPRKPAMLGYFINGLPAPNLFQEMYASLSFDEQQIIRRWSSAPEPAEDVLFVGCVGKTVCYDIENSRVLQDLPKYGPSDVCCGELAYRGGVWENYSRVVERLLARLEKVQAERLICYCGSCYNFLGHILPKVYGKSLPFRLVSLYQWLLEKVKGGELEVKKPLGYRAAIHESCYVSELGHDFQEALRELYRIAGVEVMELEHNRDESLSCGAASIARRWSLFDLLREQNKRYREVKASGNRDMALNCPGCFLTLAPTSWLHGIRVHYMVEELLRAFGDDINTPLARRLPRFAWLLTKRAPLALKKIEPPFPGLQAR